MAGRYRSAQLHDGPRDHNIHYGNLAGTREGGDTVLSPVLRAPTTQLSDRLVGKMNLLGGLDVPGHVGHGYHQLGNYGPLSATDDHGLADQATVDQVIAHASTTYPSPPRKRSMHMGFEGLSVTWTNPSSRSGGFQQSPTSFNSRALFDEIYEASGPTPEPRPPVVDRVLQSYNRLNSPASTPGARLSVDDR